MVQVRRGRGCLGHLPAPGCAPAAGLPHGALLQVQACWQTTEAQRHQARHPFTGHTSAALMSFLHLPSNNAAATVLGMVNSSGWWQDQDGEKFRKVKDQDGEQFRVCNVLIGNDGSAVY